MILIDKNVMGKETGLGFSHLLRKLRPNSSTKLPEIPPKIILLATSTSSSECSELKSAGLGDDVLTKPIRLNELISCLREALRIGKKRYVNREKSAVICNILRYKKILVVDDNVVNRRVAEGALKKYGAIVTCVESGKGALSKLNPPHNFDPCFMDLRMPEMDGFEATRQIRSLECRMNEKIESGEASIDVYRNVAHWHTPVLAMTADACHSSNK